jgi:DNA-binding SARP family transcriptional activator
MAVAARDWVRASDLYAGPFAAGFSLSEAPGFEEWLDEERRRLAGEGHKALLAAARQAEAEGDLCRALPHWRRLTLSDALNTRFAVGYIRTLSVWVTATVRWSTRGFTRT